MGKPAPSRQSRLHADNDRTRYYLTGISPGSNQHQNRNSKTAALEGTLFSDPRPSEIGSADLLGSGMENWGEQESVPRCHGGGCCALLASCAIYSLQLLCDIINIVTLPIIPYITLPIINQSIIHPIINRPMIHPIISKLVGRDSVPGIVSTTSEESR